MAAGLDGDGDGDDGFGAAVVALAVLLGARRETVGVLVPAVHPAMANVAAAASAAIA